LALTDSPRSLTDMLNTPTQQLWHQTMLPQIMERGSWQGQIALLRHSETLWFESQWFLIRDQCTHQPLGLGTIARPLPSPQPERTVLKALAKEQNRNQQKSQFLANAAHDLKTPLAVISTSIDLLNNDQLSSERKQKHFQRLRSKVRQMTQVLDQVLMLSRDECSEIRVQSIDIDPIHLCAEVVEESQMNSDRHEIVFSAVSSAPLIQTDPELLQRILANLLSNSVKYSPNGGKIDCRLSIAADTLTLQVQDSGIGIPHAEQSQLFRPFYRANNTGTISGNGLGLAIVKKCTDRLGGQITVRSTAQAGTCVTITIPLEHCR
jgi:signal transduction histidine kinase